MKHPLILIFFALLSFGCVEDSDVVRVLTIHEGEHAAKPKRFKYNDDRLIIYEWHLGQSWRYNLGDNDQCDWNKLTGVSFDVETNHNYSLMVAWRYDLDGYILFSPYYHDEGIAYWARTSCTLEAAGIGLPLPTLKAKTTDTIRTTISIDRDELLTVLLCENLTTNESFEFVHEWNRAIGKVRHINPWFGGTKSAPHDIVMGRRYIDSR